MSQQPTNTPPHTRQKTNTSTTKKSQKELENAEGSNTDVRTKEQAIIFLTTKEYLTPDKPADLQTLSHVLLQFSSATTARIPKLVTDGIRAVAFLIADAGAQQMATEITEIVKTQLQEHMETFTSEVETMRDAIEHVKEAAKDITGKMDDFNNEIQETTDQLTQVTQELTEKTSETIQTPIQKPMTYASITQQYIPPVHETAISRGETSDKQLIIQKDPNATDNALNNLTEKDLVAKANTALDLMGTDASNKPSDTNFVGAKKLRNGNVIYQLNSKEAANWLKQLDTQKAFIANYGGTTNIRNKLYHVIAEFVPTSFDAGTPYAHAKAEKNSSLNPDSIAFSKYIKPPHLRNDNQKAAHAIIGFKERSDANSAIKNGMFIEGKHINIRKMISEPRRCLKCQKFGHYATDCKITTDICARCNGQHRTTTCYISNTADFLCTNCPNTTAKGHGAADRNCPIFKSEQEKLQKRSPENKYHFFPTHCPSTWRLLNDLEPETHSTNQQQTGSKPNTQFQNHNERPREHYSEDWRTIQRRRGRQSHHNNHQQESHNHNHNQHAHRTGANRWANDNGWPVKPAQTTLDRYMNPSLTSERQPAQQQLPYIPPVQWGDSDPNEQGPGPLPTRSPLRRDSPTLEYV